MNANLIEGIIFLALVVMIYAVYFARGDKKKARDASKSLSRTLYASTPSW